MLLFKKHFYQNFVALVLVISLVTGCSNDSSDASADSSDEPTIITSNSIQISVLETGVDGGPELTSNVTDDAGIHLWRFFSWTNPDQARSELAALPFSDGGDRSVLADVLVREGGTLIALYAGLQSSSGIVDTDIESVEINDERLTVSVKTQVLGSCSADAAFATPFRILHVAAIAPNVLFREFIQQCVEDEIADTTRISNITVDFLDDATARINWIPPMIAGEQTRYDVIDIDIEEEIYDGTDEPSYTIANIVPGIIYTRRIVPIDSEGEVLSQGTPVALMVDAPSDAFRGRASLDALEKLKTRLAGNEAKDCGGISVLPGNNDAATQVSDCIIQSLNDGIAFTADNTVGALRFALVNDGESSSWLLKLLNSDVSLTNDFAPSNGFMTNNDFGGSLTGQVCSFPAVLINTNFSQFTC